MSGKSTPAEKSSISLTGIVSQLIYIVIDIRRKILNRERYVNKKVMLQRGFLQSGKRLCHNTLNQSFRMGDAQQSESAEGG